MVSHVVPPQIPLVLHRLVADVALHAASLSVDVHYVLLQVELIAEPVLTEWTNAR